MGQQEYFLQLLGIFIVEHPIYLILVRPVVHNQEYVLEFLITGMAINIPFQANGYSGIFTYRFGSLNDREIMGVQLQTPLIIEKKYYFSCYISRAAGNSTRGATNNFGFKFSTIPYDASNNIAIDNFSHYRDTTIIEDSIGWTKISGAFIADSAYQYLALGNFYDDINTDTIDMAPIGQPVNYAYYYVDLVCVTEDSANCNPINFLNDFNQQEISIFPNPFSDNIKF
jgi:hypothetical protein